MTALSLERLTPMSLDQVVAGWSLQDREDRKYVIPLVSLNAVIAAHRSSYGVLRMDRRSSFSYRTQYFDTPDGLSYQQHARGVRRRFKVRVRHYLDSDLHRLEVKTKGTGSRTVKFALDGTCSLTGSGLDFVWASLAQSYGPTYPARIVGALQPGLTMTYRRTTLVSLHGGERVTVDTQLCVDHSGVRAWLLPALALVEVKATEPRCDTDRWLLGAGCRPISFSKYVAGVEVTTGRSRRHSPRMLRSTFSLSS
jgi:hypothetical protein